MEDTHAACRIRAAKSTAFIILFLIIIREVILREVSCAFRPNINLETLPGRGRKVIKINNLELECAVWLGAPFLNFLT